MSDLSTMGFQASRKSPQGSSAVFPWRILVISLVVFVLTAIVYIGIEFGYKPYLEKQIKDVEAASLALEKQIDEKQRNDLIDFYSQLYNIKSLSASHLYPYAIFEYLEKNTNSLVKINSAQINVLGREIKMDALAPDYETIIGQIASYKSDSRVGSITLDSSKKRDPKDGGGVSFSIKIIFSNSMFGSQASQGNNN